MLLSILVAGLSCVGNVQTATSTYKEPNVPTGTPIAGNYAGPLRPQVHFSPPKNFMNDPNGMFLDSDGLFHLYYQYNPTDVIPGNQHWGHATSKDLYHWINQPIAIFPVNSTSYIYSGSCVVDVNNTSGFFPNQNNGVVAIYTTASYAPNTLQTQCISYSRDGGYTFVSFDENPVININSAQFRDPKVIWYKDHWVMVVSYATDFVIGFYTSHDLKKWTHASNFTHAGLLGLQYECPNLVEMPVEELGGTKWVLQISINPGAPLGGSIAQSFIGDFDGHTFEPIDKAARINDFGKDNYAGQFFYGTPQGADALSIAWASNWQYTQDVPTGSTEGWRSTMSLPRKNSIQNLDRIGLTIINKPYDLGPVLGKKMASSPDLGNGSIAVDYSMVESNALYVSVNVTNVPSANVSTYSSLNFTFMSPVSGEYLQGGHFFGNNFDFWLNRGGIRGYENVFFTDKFSTSSLAENQWSLEMVIDRSILEVFGNSGGQSATTLFYPEQPLTLFTLASGFLPHQGKVSVAVYALKSAWAKQENDMGIVVGNVSSSSVAADQRRHDSVIYRPEFDLGGSNPKLD